MEVSSEMAKTGQKPSKKLWAGSERNLAKYLASYQKVTKPVVKDESE